MSILAEIEVVAIQLYEQDQRNKGFGNPTQPMILWSDVAPSIRNLHRHVAINMLVELGDYIENYDAKDPFA